MLREYLDMERLVIPGLSSKATSGLVVGTLSLFGIAGLVGLGANALLISSVLRNPELRVSPTYITLVSLALSDVFVLLFLPCFIYILYTGDAPLILCKLFMYGMLSALGCSIYHIVGFSVLRYIILIKPLFAMKHVTVKVTVAMCVVIWVSALAWSAPTIQDVFPMNFNSSLANQSVQLCAITYTSSGYLFITWTFIAFLPFCLIVGFHVAKACQLRRKKICTEGVAKRRQVSARIILGILVTFALSSIPSGVGWLVVLTHPQYASLEVAIVIYLLTALLFVNSGVDPLLYFYFSRGYKKKSKSVIESSQKMNKLTLPSPNAD